MRALRTLFLVVAGVLVAGLLAVAAGATASVVSTTRAQDALQPFYTPPNPLPGPPGTLIRSEPLDVDVPGGTAHRILYVSERLDGTPAASGGIVYLPTAPAPAGGRPVVAWAHGTLGMADQCAPSRSSNPLQDTDNWLDQMMALGWVVTATDYVGLGTPGPEAYLVAGAEVRDVVNAVRAAREFPDAEAGSRYVVFGHSQGGHTSLWSGHLAEELAPELDLLGVAAAAPAANLVPIMSAQWATAVGWAIGPEVAISWPPVYPDVALEGVVSGNGIDSYQRLADECIDAAGLEGLARTKVGQTFFDVDPTTVAGWRDAATAQTVPPLPASMPVMVAQGTADEVVLPGPNALLQQQWCDSGSALTMLWMGGIGHLAAATTSGPAVVPWIADRFADRPAGRTCDTPPPVAPSPPGA